MKIKSMVFEIDGLLDKVQQDMLVDYLEKDLFVKDKKLIYLGEDLSTTNWDNMFIDKVVKHIESFYKNMVSETTMEKIKQECDDLEKKINRCSKQCWVSYLRDDNKSLCDTCKQISKKILTRRHIVIKHLQGVDIDE